MFEFMDKIRKFIWDPSESECYDKLIKKFLTKDEIDFIPMFGWFVSDIKIGHNDETYQVGLIRNGMSEHVSLGIVNIYGNDVFGSEKCQFVVKHIDEIEESIKDISNLLKKKIEKNKEKKECRDKCLTQLEELVKTRT